MSYSDEPNVVADRARPKKIYFFVGAGFLLFFLLLASVAFSPKIHEFRREHTPVGDHGGSLYQVELEGEPFTMELARPEEGDYHLWVYLEPEEEGTDWRPEAYSVVMNTEGAESETLEWEAESGGFGPSELRFHPMVDYEFALEVKRGEEIVWDGRRWSFRVETGAHDH